MEGSLKPGTKVRSKVATMLGGVQRGDVLTILPGVRLGKDQFEVVTAGGTYAVLLRHEFTVMEDQGVSADEMDRRKRKALHGVYNLINQSTVLEDGEA